MSVDRDTNQTPEAQVIETQEPSGTDANGVNGVDVRGASTEPLRMTPPPASAPGEFLEAQWVKTSSRKVHRDGATVDPTPPPASAPSEFLEAQWQEPVKDTWNADEELLKVFAEGFPETVLDNEDLERLRSEALREGQREEPSQAAETPGADSPPRLRVRNVPLEADETITSVFLPNDGVSNRVPQSGQALILTSKRLIAFRGVEGYRDTHMAMTSEIVQCSVRTGQRNWSAVLQGLMIVAGGAFLYLIVGYWLAGQISGPNVPVLNIDVAPLISLLIILVGLFVLLQNYLTRPAGAVIFHGAGVEIAFPFRSSLDMGQVYDFVDLVTPPRR